MSIGKPCHYCDGTLSREVEEDDFESTGHEEMNELYDKCKPKVSVLNARDKLCELDDFITVCIEALMESKMTEINKIVGSVLYFHVRPAIQNIEKELAKPCTQLKLKSDNIIR